MAHYVLILAGGRGKRLNQTTPKQFLDIKGVPILMHSINSFYVADPSCKIYVGLPEGYLDLWRQLCQKKNFIVSHTVYVGGKQRTDTVRLGLEKVSVENECREDDLISIHDGARPFVSSGFILELLVHAKKNGFGFL